MTKRLNVPYIETRAGITMSLKGRPYSLERTHKDFDAVRSMVLNGANQDEVLSVITKAERLLKEKLNLTPNMIYSGGAVEFNGQVLHNYAVDRLVAMVTAGQDPKPLAYFLEKLQANPSKRVVDNLYAFLEHGRIPITPDGDFLAYKAVRQDFKDIHSGKFDNSVGQVCSMPRNHVDEDPDRTCSAGLHVCSFDYLPHFAHDNGHVVLCKINPADVVAIPADYNNTKMRVARYEVVDVVTGYYAKKVDVLGNVGEASGVMAGKYTVRAIGVDGDPVEGTAITAFTVREAKGAGVRMYDEFEMAMCVQILDAEDFVVFSYDGETWS